VITPERIENAKAELRRARVDVALVALGRVLVELDGELDWPYYLGRPEKWAREYVAWCDHGQPSDPGSTSWESFADAIEEVRR